ncbi:hypothetical protein FHS95_000294 [Sphingomonas naasensis]|uniref:Uncharacterized protein n=1 Tax=Sphingomonas naasensis TaxID=1344951 RepID=A0A4S1WR81_9SPHN|nr:hypothetical protein [Sphingomonas naasensis]NIJ18625.1 hypothetical protein [Sphingomonas naasensis]TGX45871.1 hypothetical protein E5A74_01435 [Sphingomonas naasensis]
MIGLGAAVALLSFLQITPPPPQPNAVYEIRSERRSSQRGSDDSSGSSRDIDRLVERVLAVREDGIELEYDLPADASEQDHAREWRFPIRIFKPKQGPMRLLNRAEMAARLDGWLKAATLTREACGRLIFTWNAFRIECEPQSVLKTLEALDPAPQDLRAGASYADPDALAPAPMHRMSTGAAGAVYGVDMAIDPEVVRRRRAQTDVGVAELSGEKLAFETALHKRSGEKISGTISLTFHADAEGRAWRRVRLTKVEIREASGRFENETTTEIVERRPASAGS